VRIRRAPSDGSVILPRFQDVVNLIARLQWGSVGWMLLGVCSLLSAPLLVCTLLRGAAWAGCFLVSVPCSALLCLLALSFGIGRCC
jgi:hypothetical protein